MEARLVTAGRQTWKQVAGRLNIESGAHVHTVTRTPPEVRSKRPDGYSLGSTELTLWQLSFSKIDQFFLSVFTYCGWKSVKESMGGKKKTPTHKTITHDKMDLLDK